MTFQGIIPALVTPYDSQGEVSLPQLQRLVRTLNTEGADGYFVTGSSAECYLLTASERLRILEATVEAADGRPALFHMAASDHRDTLELAHRAADAGATGISANIPTYFTYTDASLATYFRDIREQTDLPLLAYYIPGQTGRRLSADFFLELAQQDVLHGMKYTSADLSVMSRIRAERPDGFPILSGADDALLGSLAQGADGGIGSTYNVICRVFAQLYAAFRAGDLAEATSLQQLVMPLWNRMDGWEFITFLKAVLRGRGLDVGQARKPMAQIPDQMARELVQALEGVAELEPYLIRPV